MVLGTLIRRIRIVVGVMLGAPCIVGRSIEVSPGGLDIGGKNAFVHGVRFCDTPTAIRVSLKG